MSLSSPSIPYILYFWARVGQLSPTQAIRLKKREMQDLLPGTFLKPGRVLDYRYSKSSITGALACLVGIGSVELPNSSERETSMQTRENSQSLLLLRHRYGS
jgi:hypothetical protein